MNWLKEWAFIEICTTFRTRSLYFWHQFQFLVSPPLYEVAPLQRGYPFLKVPSQCGQLSVRADPKGSAQHFAQHKVRVYIAHALQVDAAVVYQSI